MINKEVTSVFVRRVLRFGVAGAWNTGVSYAIYASCIYLGAPYYAATMVVHILANINNYVTFSLFVFRDRPRATGARFAFGFVLQYVFGTGVLGVIIDIVGINAYLAPFVALPIIAAGSFVINNWLVFHNKPADKR